MSVLSIVCLSIACICNSISIILLFREKRRSKSELKILDLGRANRLQSSASEVDLSVFSKLVRDFYSDPPFIAGDNLYPDND